VIACVFCTTSGIRAQVREIKLTANMVSTKFEVEKFNGKNNFSLWQRRLKDLLIQQGVHKGLLEKAKKPEKMDNDVWEEMDAKAASAIHLNLLDEVIHNVIDEDNAKSIWQKLESLYMAKNLTNKLYVKKQLYGLQMEENTDLLEHLNKFNMLNTQLLNFGVKIGEEDKAILLLASLPPSYNHLVTTLLYGKETLAFEEVTGSLLSHETRRKPINDQADGLVARLEPKRGRDKFKGKIGRGKQSWSMSRSA
jgi:hypothetical protein